MEKSAEHGRLAPRQPERMCVVSIRLYGADEVSELVGPFDTLQAANAWIAKYGTGQRPDGNPTEWYDIFELTPPNN